MGFRHHNRKSPGYEFWSRRSNTLGCGPISKWITKRGERQHDRVMCHKAMKDNEDYRLRIPGE